MMICRIRSPLIPSALSVVHSRPFSAIPRTAALIFNRKTISVPKLYNNGTSHHFTTATGPSHESASSSRATDSTPNGEATTSVEQFTLVKEEDETVDDFRRVPDDIVSELDQYIIGQREAKRSLAVALRVRKVDHLTQSDRWRRQQLTDKELQAEVTPNNILLVGPSGCGKTELAKRLAKFAGAPFIKAVATKYTEVGFVGDDTQSMIHDLAEQAYADEKRRRRGLTSAEARRRAESSLVEALKRSVSGLEDQDSDVVLMELRSGRLDSVDVEIDSSLLTTASDQPPNPFQQLFDTVGSRGGSPNMRPGGPPFAMPAGAVAVPISIGSDFMSQLGLGGAGNRKREKKRKLRVEEAMPLLEDHFAAELMNEEEIIASSRIAAEQRGIVFIDEFDKLVDPKDGQEFRGKRRGVQKELLSLMEGTSISTRIGRISTDHILFIASGAFTSSKPTDIMPELQGRLPIRAELQPLTSSDFKCILRETKFNLLIQQCELLKTEGVTLEFSDDAIDEIAEAAYQLNTVTANVGARRLKTVVAKLLEDVKFEAHKLRGQTVRIDAPTVQTRLESLRSQSDLTRYIL